MACRLHPHGCEHRAEHRQAIVEVAGVQELLRGAAASRREPRAGGCALGGALVGSRRLTATSGVCQSVAELGERAPRAGLCARIDRRFRHN